MKGAAKRIGLEIVGWTLVVAGIAALILPGPGLLMIAGGLVLLSQQYEWAERRVEPIKREALKGAANSVETWPRIIATSTMILLIAAAGVLWFVGPEVPDWWPIARALVAAGRQGHEHLAVPLRPDRGRAAGLELPEVPRQPRGDRRDRGGREGRRRPRGVLGALRTRAEPSVADA